mmetsp:Transcript_29432/g.41979  ORF Transcript_29432/g.41979 Transcript_29432/m.41979 type:complete len:653 (-) Transcript_29432:14-1972(-)
MSAFVPPRYGSLIRLYGSENYDKIRKSRILVVGAGGIGCEILKNLAYLGVAHVELVDLDTIDVSNLNRQFLFRPEHVGKPKAIVAGSVAVGFNSDMHVQPHYDNIKSSLFSVDFISTFSIVLNALDNLDARRHVNRLCLAAKVPLIDSGTTGYLGQVTPIVKGMTTCYECYPKAAQKVYPICTIRSTPDKPVHCIVWAKECFKLLFGNSSESMLFEDETSSGEKSTYMSLIAFPAEAASVEEVITQYGCALVTALFDTEIQKRIDMGVYKTAKHIPFSLPSELVADAGRTALMIALQQQGEVAPHGTQGWELIVWSVKDCIVTFLLCLFELSVSQRDRALLGSLSFDKDDLWAMRFVCAAANLRMHVFHISPLLSYHDSKGIAGNIVPAISTTNAIVAGIQVAQAVKIITAADASLYRGGRSVVSSDSSASASSKELAQTLCHTYCLRLPTRRGLYLQPLEAEGPAAACYVCGTAQISLQIDTEVSTLGDLVLKVLKGKLAFGEVTVMLGSSVIFEEGEDADEDMQQSLQLKLNCCPAGGVVGGTVLCVEDATQKAQVLVKHVPSALLLETGSEAIASDMFLLGDQDAFALQQANIAKAAESKVNESSSSNSNSDNDDIIVCIDDAPQESVVVEEKGDYGSLKRKREDDLDV